MPIILVCSQFWAGIVDWFRETLAKEGMIDPDDMNLIQVIDEPKAVVDAIFKFYETRGFELSPTEREMQFSL